jgi:hypothetical protein
MILSFSVIGTVAKINTKIRIKVINKISNNHLKFICAKFHYRFSFLHIGTSATSDRKICHNAYVFLLYWPRKISIQLGLVVELAVIL